MKKRTVATNAPAQQNAVYEVERSSEKIWLHIDFSDVVGSAGRFSLQSSIDNSTYSELLSAPLPSGTSTANAITISAEVNPLMSVRLVYTASTTVSGSYTIYSMS
jgi:hypothetical protein